MAEASPTNRDYGAGVTADGVGRCLGGAADCGLDAVALGIGRRVVADGVGDSDADWLGEGVWLGEFE